jgi:hypothetical protein
MEKNDVLSFNFDRDAGRLEWWHNGTKQKTIHEVRHATKHLHFCVGNRINPHPHHLTNADFESMYGASYKTEVEIVTKGGVEEEEEEEEDQQLRDVVEVEDDDSRQSDDEGGYGDGDTAMSDEVNQLVALNYATID